MQSSNFTTTINTKATPLQVFNAVNNVTGWWNDNFKGASQNIGDEFEVQFGDMHYSKQRLAEVIPGKKVAWLVTDSDLTFLNDRQEWNGTRIVFDITEDNGHTVLRLTHEGLVPEAECYNMCTPAWTQYMRYSLLSLIEKGKGQPGFPPAGPLQ